MVQQQLPKGRPFRWATRDRKDTTSSNRYTVNLIDPLTGKRRGRVRSSPEGERANNNFNALHRLCTPVSGGMCQRTYMWSTGHRRQASAPVSRSRSRHGVPRLDRSSTSVDVRTICRSGPSTTCPWNRKAIFNGKSLEDARRVGKWRGMDRARQRPTVEHHVSAKASALRPATLRRRPHLVTVFTLPAPLSLHPFLTHCC